MAVRETLRGFRGSLWAAVEERHRNHLLSCPLPGAIREGSRTAAGRAAAASLLGARTLSSDTNFPCFRGKRGTLSWALLSSSVGVVGARVREVSPAVAKSKWSRWSKVMVLGGNKLTHTLQVPGRGLVFRAVFPNPGVGVPRLPSLSHVSGPSCPRCKPEDHKLCCEHTGWPLHAGGFPSASGARLGSSEPPALPGMNPAQAPAVPWGLLLLESLSHQEEFLSPSL